MSTNYIAKAVALVTEGRLMASERTGFVEIENPSRNHIRLCEALLRGKWIDAQGSLLARDNGGDRISEVFIDGGVLALYQVFGQPFLVQLEALSRLIHNQ
jgi:hypothetical protein